MTMRGLLLLAFSMTLSCAASGCEAVVHFDRAKIGAVRDAGLDGAVDGSPVDGNVGSDDGGDGAPVQDGGADAAGDAT